MWHRPNCTLRSEIWRFKTNLRVLCTRVKMSWRLRQKLIVMIWLSVHMMTGQVLAVFFCFFSGYSVFSYAFFFCCWSLLLRYLHFPTSEVWCWSGGMEILRNLTLCCSIVYHYNGAQWHKQFLLVSRLYQGLFLIGLTLCFLSTSYVFILLFMCFNFFFCYICASVSGHFNGAV